MKLRAHHICCEPWVEVTGRGEAFLEMDCLLKEHFHSKANMSVELVRGCDDLCQPCPFNRDNRCESPEGDEDEVRKLDTIIMKELDVTQGTTLTFKEWMELLRQKLPLKICQRCHSKIRCAIHG